ncbi:MAG: hypothetical protein JNM57_14560 [Cyclobacteriaceae bacterium]|nr:hypothetical protein [Cyclobacteriaceae bacterium]
MITRIAVLLFVYLLSGCSPNDPQRIINRAIQAHGGKRFEHVDIEFDFRERHYTAHRDGGVYSYTRAFTDSTGNVKDILNNSGFQRSINGTRVTVPAERANAFSNSINSVIYFALLPFGLNDPAVHKSFAGETVLKNKKYYLIRITFDEEGGGKDHEDEFLYWINQETHRVDYLAYNYTTDGGGVRFRQAINPRMMDGILFQDYINYQADKDVPLEKLQELFEKNQLQELSTITLENISVKKLK